MQRADLHDAGDAADRSRARSVPIEFLQKLRPGGPWVLTAIEPDGPTVTVTAHTADEIEKFVRRHDGRRNIYYSLNPLRGVASYKAKKIGIAAIEYVHADLDPCDDESPEAAKARYLKTLEALPRPSACIDTGNGLQILYRLERPINLAADADNAATIADTESRNKNLMVQLGSKTGTQNIDRILRLPGTTNLPNRAKRKLGRVECSATLLWFEATTHPLSAFPAESESNSSGGTKRRQRGNGAAHPGGADAASGSEADELARTIRDGGEGRHGPTRSDAMWYVVNEMLRLGHADKAIATMLVDKRNGISQHIYDQPGGDPAGCAERQVAHAKEKITLAVDNKGIPWKTRENVNVALLKLGVTVRYDRFADRVLITGLDGFGPALDDAAVVRLWLTMDRRFRLAPSKELMFTVIMDTARINEFHPVQDYLDGLAWDGKKRLDTWLAEYGGAEENEYTQAVGALMLTAAVRRVRQPGCKFDEMVVLENSEQGTNKSSTLAVLAIRDEWFSDDLPLNLEGKRVIEALRGKWIVEAAELAGMRRADIEHIKALLSRQHDRGRLAYDRIVSEIPRQCLVVGTTNATEYLKDTTGNRRFWPVLCSRFDLKALKRDRDQLWAEAAAREAGGCSIRLHSSLWPKAAEEQAKRLTDDPFLPALQDALGDRAGKISVRALWEVLDIKAGQLHQEQSRRVSDAMRRLGWRRPNTAALIKIEGKLVVGWVKGLKPWTELAAYRDPGERLVIIEVPDNEEV